MLLAFLLTAVNFLRMLGADLHDPVVISYWSWMPTGALSVDAAIQLDQLSMLMMMVITGVGFLIHVFSVGYMKEDPGYPRYFAYLNLFVFFMLVLVTGANFPVMFVGWEGVGTLLLSPHRVLVPGPGEGGRREEGLHREPGGRRGPAHGHVHPLFAPSAR
jgi:NADH:ubiquinone oxidoreductase subunit 5 (subunit L)/multisubunit Na+/H+ antiporter MnhA subunit